MSSPTISAQITLGNKQGDRSEWATGGEFNPAEVAPKLAISHISPTTLAPLSRCCGQKPHQEGMGTKEEGISNKGGGRTFFDGWLLGVVSLSTQGAPHTGEGDDSVADQNNGRGELLPARAFFSLSPSWSRRASQARGKGEGRYSRWPSLLFNLPHPWAPQEEGRGIAGGFFLSRRKGVHTRDLTPRYRRNVAEGEEPQGAQPSRGEGRKRGAALGNHSERQERGGRLCEGQDHSRHWRGWHGDWLPRRPPVGIVARARDLCCARFGGREIRGRDRPELTKSTGRRPNPQKTPHTPGPNTTANRAPPAPRQGEDALRTPHQPRPGKRLTFSRVEGGEQRAPNRQPRCTASCPPATLALRPAPAPRGTRARLAAFQPSPARSAGVGRGPRWGQGSGDRRGHSAARPGGQGRQPLRRPGSQDPQSLPRFRGREPERQGLPRGGGGHARAAAGSASARESAGGRRAQAARSGARPNQQAAPAPPAQGPRPAPTASSPPPPAAAEVVPPIVVGTGPQPTRPRAGAARPRGPGKAAPPTAPAARTPKACPAFGDGSRRGRGFLAAAGATPAASASGSRGRRGRGPTSRGPPHRPRKAPARSRRRARRGARHPPPAAEGGPL
ncbi:hypothetical protein C7M84_025147 [Penaeus vannamei]|uniref:Uncharacterized protein n=1 Tax=Penaeus vannamei TaxID=6689 RepID=A0A3R7PSX6_PENVA|nr:hypothetical protein C7M84_025147 [Penaeus vannamei]